jgi:hypothetical protein
MWRSSWAGGVSLPVPFFAFWDAHGVQNRIGTAVIGFIGIISGEVGISGAQRTRSWSLGSALFYRGPRLVRNFRLLAALGPSHI